ncbi:hypothetical protein [Xanthobacter versatilis]|uniref:hypothetical protein n=1 Tax=Xanthobacter autotrophicus (strain ATCC BAA-1158 / Py2) TaxID=78245 RepID=UPI003726C0E8
MMGAVLAGEHLINQWVNGVHPHGMALAEQMFGNPAALIQIMERCTRQFKLSS